MKYLLLAIVLVAAVLWIRHKAAAARRADTAPRTAAAETMVPCAHCGVHVPAREALRDPAGAAFCSPAHRDTGSGTR
ncbi:MAG: hypothetical protein JNM90_11650 [Burkholderiales bacterium]|nr:hypothetical protein [Burkholderiales bacterium]